MNTIIRLKDKLFLNFLLIKYKNKAPKKNNLFGACIK